MPAGLMGKMPMLRPYALSVSTGARPRSSRKAVISSVDAKACVGGAPATRAILSARLVPPMSSTPACVSTPSSLRSV